MRDSWLLPPLPFPVEGQSRQVGGEVDIHLWTLASLLQASSTGCSSLPPPDEGKVTVLVTAPSAGLSEDRRGGWQVWEAAGSPLGCEASCPGWGVSVDTGVILYTCLSSASYFLVGSDPWSKTIVYSFSPKSCELSPLCRISVSNLLF